MKYKIVSSNEKPSTFIGNFLHDTSMSPLLVNIAFLVHSCQKYLLTIIFDIYSVYYDEVSFKFQTPFKCWQLPSFKSFSLIIIENTLFDKYIKQNKNHLNSQNIYHLLN